jgi:hypothetical protein
LADVAAGLGVVVGEGDLLGVAEDPEVDLGCSALGAVPKVEAVGEEGIVLGFDEDEDEEGRTALVEVLALGIFTFALGVVAVAGEGLAEVVPVCSG